MEVITQSIINSWGMCPERVRRRYIEDEIIPPGIAARIGTGVHKGVEVNSRAKKETGQDEPLDVVMDAARDGYVSALKGGVFFAPNEKSTAKKQMAEGVDKVVGMAKLYLIGLAPSIDPDMIEERIIIPVPGISVPLSGAIDLTDKNSWMIDIKTAGKKWPESKAEGSIQATMYAALYHTKTGNYPSKISFEIFTSTKTPVHQSIETKRNEKDFEVLKLRIQQIINSMNAGIFPPAEPGHWSCSPKWCGYWWTCQYIPEHKKILPK